MKKLSRYGNRGARELADGIFLTHAHIGHYSGLMYLGREAMNAQNTPVYAMPRIQGPSKTALFIPDINKWEVWDKDVFYC